MMPSNAHRKTIVSRGYFFGFGFFVSERADAETVLTGLLVVFFSKSLPAIWAAFLPVAMA